MKRRFSYKKQAKVNDTPVSKGCSIPDLRRLVDQAQKLDKAGRLVTYLTYRQNKNWCHPTSIGLVLLCKISEQLSDVWNESLPRVYEALDVEVKNDLLKTAKQFLTLFEKE